MAFAASGLTRLASGGGANVWFYRSTDAAGTINTSGYFTGDSVDYLNVGDLIIQQQVDSATAPTSVTAGTLMWVLSNDGTTVDVSDGTAIVVTDTD